VYCPKCGEENDEKAKFCEKCGSKLKTGPLAPKHTPQPEKKGWSTTNKVLIIGCVILIVVLGVMVGLLLKSNSIPTIGTNNTIQPTTITQSTGIPLSQVPNLAQSITLSGVGFSSIKFGGVTLDKNQCLYITARAIVMLNNGETGNIPISQYGNPNNPYGTVTSATIAKGDYVSMAQRTYTWMDANGRAPNYLGIKNPGQPELAPYDTLNLYSKVLTAYKNSGQLPASIQIP